MKKYKTQNQLISKQIQINTDQDTIFITLYAGNTKIQLIRKPTQLNMGIKVNAKNTFGVRIYCKYITNLTSRL